MSRPSLTIFYQLDPYNPTIGGVQTCIKYVIKYAPQAFDLRLVGITSDPSMAIGKWHEAHLHGRDFQFMPLLFIEDDNIRHLVPTTLRYALALSKHTISSDFLQFHRMEPTFLVKGWSGRKILYNHNDIEKQVRQKGKGGILWRRFPWAYFALEKTVIHQFDRILACNSSALSLYKRRYPELADRVSYLRNTFDGALFYPLAADEKEQARLSLAQRLSLPSDTRFILFVGRLHPQKDPVLLIRSIAQLNQPNVHLLIVGDGELKDDVLSEIQKLGLSKVVTLMAPVSQEELADLYRSCQIFTLTSVFEGLARSSIESLACGIPVVMTRAGETPKFLSNDAGVICDERSPDAIANAYRQVLDHPDHYPSSACVRVAHPFEAETVVSGLYGEFLEQWRSETAAA